MHSTHSPSPEPEEFSLVAGGPLYQMYLRARLAQPPLRLLHRRILAMALITWLPLLLLAIAGGTAWSGVKVPFLFDLDSHARFLICVPLLLLAELLVHAKLAHILRGFIDRELIAPEDRERFDRAIATAVRLRNSVPLEITLLVIAFVIGHLLWRDHFAMQVNSWYLWTYEGGQKLTVAGCWYAFVSLPLFRFLSLRWYFRGAIWYGLLWRISRLPLRLNALHPDRTAGLGFLGHSVVAFIPILLSQTVLLSALIGDHIWHEGATLLGYKMEIIAAVLLLVLVCLAPLGFFILQLLHAKQVGRNEYETQANRYVNEFRRKWLNPGGGRLEEFLGSADIQSLADLGNSYQIIREMRLFPFGKRELILLVLVISLPLIPLVLTVIPLAEIVQRLMTLMM